MQSPSKIFSNVMFKLLFCLRMSDDIFFRITFNHNECVNLNCSATLKQDQGNETETETSDHVVKALR